VIKPWDCPEKELHLGGHPKYIAKKKEFADALRDAIKEAEVGSHMG
jgi:hypothetical protein